MTSVTQRGQYSKSVERREAILTAALEVFSESGFWNGSVRDVAVRAGISHAGLMHHFPTKTDLLLGVLTKRDVDLENSLGSRHLTGADLVWTMVEVAQKNADTPRLTAAFAVLSAEATYPDHPAHDYFEKRTASVFGTIHDAFALAEAAGAIRQGVDIESATRRLMALMDGLQVLWLYDGRTDMAADLRAYLDSVMKRSSRP